MTPDIIVAIVTGLFTLSGTVLAVCLGNKKNAKQAKEQSDLTLYRIAELEKKQDKYNHLQERQMNIEKKVDVLEEKVDAIDKKINLLHHNE